ncbi:hypothetical protein BDV3_002012 [Batrachochytrium dendrobatidis]|uniref:Uncharacterized protein n=1 Tax=Batrachochytrium dendrobatidis (strain JEL423) TaxID=403673 RepID=A0A177WTP6_BATDL|nr:hypothetical protein O5D80_007318 [Batrachochytrium dendrobatidis]KAK5664907.1 hypothetical protein QVD99_008446 [Batrachochytrium dendrobatidis]OAJ43509.1 hypothetical protein BDEG_26865 [Batrachochytrium dendrobatidis JEL423]
MINPLFQAKPRLLNALGLVQYRLPHAPTHCIFTTSTILPTNHFYRPLITPSQTALSQSKNILLALYTLRQPIIEITLWLTVISMAWGLRQTKKDMINTTEKFDACKKSLVQENHELRNRIELITSGDKTSLGGSSNQFTELDEGLSKPKFGLY